MALVVSDRIKETTTTTGTGTYTLAGAVTGFETFTANLSNGDTTYYACSDGTDFEVGLGTFTSSGTTLARTTILASSNSNAAVSWSSGTRTIFCTLPAAKAVFLDGSDDLTLVGANGNIVFDKSDDALEFADNVEAVFGTGGDLTIVHSGTHSSIKEQGTGQLRIQSNKLHVLNASQTETMLKATEDGSVELYYDDVLKFETTSGGIEVTGTVTDDGATHDGDVTFTGTSGNIVFDKSSDILKFDDSVNAMFGTGNDFRLFHASGASVIRDQNSNPIYLQTDGTFFVTKNNAAETMAKFISDGAVELYHNNVKKFETTSTGATVTGELKTTTLEIGGTDVTSTAAELNILDGVTATTSELNIMDGVTSTTAELNILDGVTATATEINKLDGVTATTTELNYVDVTTLGTVEASKAVTADANGDVKFPDLDVLSFGTGADLKIFHNPNHSVIQEQGSGNLFIDASNLTLRNGTGAANYATFTDGGAAELNHNNVKKFETTSDGATVTGNATISSTADGGPILNLISNDHSDAADFHTEATIKFLADNSADEQTEYANIQLKTGDVTDGTEDGWIYFGTKANGTLNNAIAISSDGGFFLLSTQTNHPVIQWNATGGTSFDIQLKTAVPTADRIITLPDTTGTVLTTGNSDTPTTTTSSSDADFVLVDDGGTMKKITPSNLGITSGGASKGFAVAMAIAL